mmetsp:Transcript_52/g.83  ORF Transcript_52/g.83 Transcript_52/m.83 type:complete len:438 (-) Transcript_52:72-1385(-)|eukprot:scaffold42455_cov183-Amphora_coffeaeformis.AAC.3
MRLLRSRHAAPFLLLLGITLVGLYMEKGVQSDLFQQISLTTSKASALYSFPKWEDNRGIVMDDLLAFILASARKLATTVASEKTKLRFPETLYVLDQEGIWVSFIIRLRTWKMMIEPRLLPTEWLMREGSRVINHEWKAAPDLVKFRWPRLSSAIYEGDGVPFLVWYGDYKSCNHHNWGNRSIPLFTTAVPVSCHFGFPMPTYKTFVLSKNSTDEWQPIIEGYRTKYSWENKIPKAVWRGSLSGENDDLQSVRWRLCQLNSTNLDVGLVSIPARHDHLNLTWDAVGGKANIIPQEEFQNYTAIIDVDGNSWSSRFGELLCYNSVVLKVEPKFVEYFYKDLIPWKHYIPIKDDLSNLLEISAYVVDPQNIEVVQTIVSHANDWCATHLVKRELGKDFLDVLEVYASHLDNGNRKWTTRWSQYKESLFTHASFDMRRIM